MPNLHTLLKTMKQIMDENREIQEIVFFMGPQNRFHKDFDHNMAL